MNIRPSAAICQNYNEIAELCRTTEESIYLTKNGEGDLVVMDINSFTRREKMLKLSEESLSIEEDRVSGRKGCGLDELDEYLDGIIAGLSILTDSPTNQQFPIFPNTAYQELQRRYIPGFWAHADEARSVLRICTSWATSDTAVDALIADIGAVCAIK